MRTKALLLVLGCIATLSLGACQSHAGAAAFVAGHRISTASLDRFVATDNASVAASVRSEALQQLIRQQLFDDLLRKHGGVPGDSGLTRFASQVLPSGTTVDAFAQAVRAAGLSASFVPLYMRNGESALVLDSRKVGLAAVCNTSVSVSPQYGAWDRSKLSLVNGVTTADFLTGGAVAAPKGCSPSG